MAIARNHKGFGNRIDKPGEYVVTVEKVDIGKSKKGDAMLTVTFVTAEDKQIQGYYVKSKIWAMKALAECKVALGLKEDSAAENMVGKKCGIAVGEGNVREDGSHFMQIEGYGKESEVEGHMDTPGGFSDEVPF